MSAPALERVARYDLPDCAAGVLRRMLRALVDLIPRSERERRWQAARCAELDPVEADDLFFSRGDGWRYSSAYVNRANGGRDVEAVAYCAGCPARVLCALSALEVEARAGYLPVGVVGGLTAPQRLNALSQEARYVR